MMLQPVRRPLGPLKSLLRRNRQVQQFVARTMATETTPTETAAASSIPPPPISTLAAKKPTTKFPNPHRLRRLRPPPSARAAHPNPLISYHAQQIRRLDRTGARTALFSKKNPDAAKPGDVLQVTTSRGEPFAGVCLSIKRAGVDTAILLRNHLTKVGVEMWYKIYSPNVLGIEIIWRRPKRARRARLYFMRKPRHDMGNVEHLVEAWRRSRNVFSSNKGRGTQGKGKAKGAKGSK
ncbi:mitochondrial 54S ribosomal protein bL19m [Apiospora aurea]|uniref:54S ribosomal protein subunit img1 n=1 Tax=Apiospora aurea TaxID=335848 RepID=A0ABR1PU97_9PEZI